MGNGDEWGLNFDLEYLLWLRPLHTAERHRPTMFHTATVRHGRSGPRILYNTPLNFLLIFGYKWTFVKDSLGREVVLLTQCGGYRLL